MVCDEHHTLWEVELDPSVRRLLDLPVHRRIAAYPDGSAAPNVRHGSDSQAKRLLRESHVGVEHVAIRPV